MRLVGTRPTLSRVSLVVLAIGFSLSAADAQVTYRTLTPPPGAPAPIDTPPPGTVPAPDAAPAGTVPPPPPDTGAIPASADHAGVPDSPRPIEPPAAKPDVNNPVKQTGEVIKDIAKGDVNALQQGPLLIHGNYCGIGNRPGTAPTDALDEACMHHDACTTDGKLPNCACDNRLKADAMRIAEDPATPPKIQALAATMAASMAILICK